MLIADAARIAAEVAIYRLRRLEMANIAGAAAICLAMALPVAIAERRRSLKRSPR